MGFCLFTNFRINLSYQNRSQLKAWLINPVYALHYSSQILSSWICPFFSYFLFAFSDRPSHRIFPSLSYQDCQLPFQSYTAAIQLVRETSSFADLVTNHAHNLSWINLVQPNSILWGVQSWDRWSDYAIDNPSLDFSLLASHQYFLQNSYLDYSTILSYHFNNQRNLFTIPSFHA